MSGAERRSSSSPATEQGRAEAVSSAVDDWEQLADQLPSASADKEIPPSEDESSVATQTTTTTSNPVVPVLLRRPPRKDSTPKDVDPFTMLRTRQRISAEKSLDEALRIALCSTRERRNAIALEKSFSAWLALPLQEYTHTGLITLPGAGEGVSCGVNNKGDLSLILPNTYMRVLAYRIAYRFHSQYTKGATLEDPVLFHRSTQTSRPDFLLTELTGLCPPSDTNGTNDDTPSPVIPTILQNPIIIKPSQALALSPKEVNDVSRKPKAMKNQASKQERRRAYTVARARIFSDLPVSNDIPPVSSIDNSLRSTSGIDKFDPDFDRRRIVPRDSVDLDIRHNSPQENDLSDPTSFPALG